MLALVGIGISAVALLLNIVGLAIPEWLRFEMGKTGLWKACGQGICVDLSSDGITGSLQATRAMEILGVLLITAALVCAILKQFVMKEQPILPKVSGGVAIVSGVCMIIGAIIFAVDYKKNFMIETDLGAGFALCIVAGILAGVAGILIFIGFKEN